MPRIGTLTQEKLDRSWEELSRTWATIGGTNAPLSDVLRGSIRTRTLSERAREWRQNRKKAPPTLWCRANKPPRLPLLGSTALWNFARS